jgi:hypothetical protein
MTDFENREFWFAKNIRLLAGARCLRGQSEAAKQPLPAQMGAKRERDCAKPEEGQLAQYLVSPV